MASIMAHSRDKRRSSHDAVDPLESVPDTGKRRRLKTSRFDFEFLDNEEQRLIQQALKISRRDVKRVEVEIPEAPTFYPTLEEFSDPVEYIKTIRPEAEKYGICKIVPPPEWKPTCQINLNNPNLFSTRTQPINSLQEGNGFDDGKKYTIGQYKQMADEFFRSWVEKHHKDVGIANITNSILAKDYWDLVETNSQEVTVEYGNDINTNQYGSGFFPRSAQKGQSKLKSPSSLSSPVKNEKVEYMKENIHHPDYYATTNWNLNNLPSAPGTLLRYLKTPINGINVPWLYVGMLFSTFCWHTEDNYFYSINYSHFGSVKQWYGVPATDASRFEKVSKDFLMGLFRETPDILHHMTTQISPSLLHRNGVNVYNCSHEAGTFVITFPKSYHGGFSCGFNVGEAVNFALLDWLPLGGEALDKYRMYGRESVFSTQRLLFTILQNRSDFRGSCKVLGAEIKRVVQDELTSREYVLSQGVRDLRKMIQLQPNDFGCIDDKATDYDDLRNCCLCKQTCLFTAIACECDRDKVTCLRHFSLMCKCSNQKKFLLAWASDDELTSYKETATNLR